MFTNPKLSQQPHQLLREPELTSFSDIWDMPYTSSQKSDNSPQLGDWYVNPYDICPLTSSPPPVVKAVEYPFTKEKKTNPRREIRMNSSTAFSTFRSYAVFELQHLGYSRPSAKLLSNVWTSMTSKERRPWKVLAKRFDSDPLFADKHHQQDGEMLQLALEMKQATIDEGPSIKDLYERLQKVKLDTQSAT